ncbi:MAG: phosphoserine phosphatase SerB [Alphaproteobacteria bacterium]
MTDLTLTLVAAPTADATTVLDDIRRRFGEAGALLETPVWLNHDRTAVDLPFTALPIQQAREIVNDLAGADTAVQPSVNRKKRVLVADMDSTMITIETLDTMADILGFGEAVKEITMRSMNGELDFADALRERVTMLKGQPAKSSMQAVMDQVGLTPGARMTVRTMAENGAYCALVSGGFTFTTEIVYKQIGFHEHRANDLHVDANGLLAGTVSEPILSRHSKLDTLQELTDARSLTVDDALCVGDGANDLDMLLAAGLGVAYYGKPVVRQQARFRIDHGTMETLLYYQGYHRDEFIDD